MCIRILAVAAAVAGITVCGMKKCCDLSQQGRALSFKDRFFLKKAARAGIYEIQAARLAISKSEDREIQSFAQMMIQEHKSLDNELKALARAKGVSVAVSAGVLHEDNLEELKHAEGVAFDVLYVKHAVKAHEGTIELFEAEVLAGSDEEVAGFALDALEMLEEHLQHAHTLQSHIQSTPES